MMRIVKDDLELNALTMQRRQLILAHTEQKWLDEDKEKYLNKSPAPATKI